MSDTTGYVILVQFRVLPEQVAAFRERLCGFAAHVTAQRGALRYEVAQHPDDATRFLLYEVFTDEAAWATHHEKPEMGALMDDIRPLLDGRPDRSVWARLTG